MRWLRCAWFAFLATACLTGAAQASIITIDNFDSVDGPTPWPVTLTAVGSTTVVESPALAGVLGGVRSTTIVGEAFGIPGLDFLEVEIAPFPTSRLGFNSSSASDGLMTLVYDAVGALGGLNADFSLALGIRVDLPLFDRAGNVDMPVQVLLDDGANTITLDRFLTAPGAQSVLFPFADFAGIGGFDLTSIDQVAVRFDPQTAQDFHLDLIETYNVPEPQTMLLGCCGAVMIAAMSRRLRS